MCLGRCGESGIKHHNPNPYSVCCDFHRMAKITCNLVSSQNLYGFILKYMYIFSVKKEKYFYSFVIIFSLSKSDSNEHMELKLVHTLGV